MSLVVFLLLVALSGLIIGALARLAVPGPDPMSIPATVGLGLLGSLLGGMGARLLGLGHAGLIFAVIGGVVVLIVYRRFWQGRAITGPTSRRAP
jgi:uncharacterized membrane protein YeaQ/YmgE (transglycosylase-associated protein family)